MKMRKNKVATVVCFCNRRPLMFRRPITLSIINGFSYVYKCGKENHMWLRIDDHSENIYIGKEHWIDRDGFPYDFSLGQQWALEGELIKLGWVAGESGDE